MAGERIQKGRITKEPRIPNKPKESESSSTWGNYQLDLFMMEQRVLDVRKMIPEKWFNFGNSRIINRVPKSTIEED
jgi:hypothetical protein